MNKSIEVENQPQELNQWQLHCWTARDKETKAEQKLNVVQHELDTMHTLADDHANLKLQYDAVTNKHKADKDILEQVIQETATLEKIVLKVTGQLNSMELVDLEQQKLATKDKAVKRKLRRRERKKNHKLAGKRYADNIRCTVTDTERICANTQTMPTSVSTPPRMRPARVKSVLCRTITGTLTRQPQ